ncbi:hypothetical protein P9E05_02045 [Bacillus mojavensis]|uniref:hypothetical protein n=1 Tax=Bacillus mojavensis TaxID=72360 RepID=UPI002DBD2087|nr:hypothetical protein [Bacillus mojavensis]MEC1690307.1 hypothetical protein [Bacillus mojavensis]
MLNNENLILLIDDFQTSANQHAFNQVFENFQLLVRNLAKKYGRNCPILFDEITSELNEKIWWIVENFDKSKTDEVSKHFKLHLSRAAIDVTRKRNGTYAKKRILFDTTAEENAATFESGEAIRIEEYVISRIDGEIKTDQDKRQLIKALTEKSDAITTAIVKEHLSSELPTYASIGSKVGVHYKKVERVIKGLAKNYDASQHGELNAFLAV